MDDAAPSTAHDLPICDVHAHYLSQEVARRLDRGRVRVRLGTVDGVEDAITANGMPVGATINQLSSVDGILEGMRAEGLERRVLSPPPFTFRYWEDPGDGADLCRALNDSLAEAIAGHDELLGLCTVPLQDVDAAIAELERAVGLGLVGVELGTFVHDENLGDDRFAPFFAAVEAAGLPILVHPDFRPNPRLAQHYLINLVGMPVETATAMANLVFNGTLDRYPRLRFCFLHGGGAAPYLYGRWDAGWRVRTDTKSRIERPPSEYLASVWCDTLTHSAEALGYLVGLVGAERVVLGTDNPFDVRDPDPRGHLARAPGVTAEQRDQIERRSPQAWLTGSADA